MTPDHDLERELERLGRSVAPGPSIADAVMQRIAPEADTPTPTTHRKRTSVLRSRTLRWLAAAAAAAAVLLTVQWWPGAAPNGIVWADVIRQLKEARTAHLHVTMRAEPGEVGGQETIIDLYLKAPDQARRDIRQGDLEGSEIVHGTKRLSLIPAQRAYRLETDASISHDYVENLLRQFAFPDVSGGKRTSLAGGQPGELVYQGLEQRGRRRLLKYRVGVAREGSGASAPAGAPAAPVNYYWFDPTNRQLVLITTERIVNGKPAETATADVRLNVDLADDLFSLAIPNGYTALPDPPLPEEVRQLLRDLPPKYRQAREAINRYRLVLWMSGRAQRWLPDARVARQGERWRADELGREPGTLTPESDFERVWQGVSVLPRRDSWLTYRGRVAAIRRSGSKVTSEWERYPDLCPLLSELGWPAWPTSPMAGEERDHLYSRLPEPSGQPGLIGIRVQRRVRDEGSAPSPDQVSDMQIYWLDPARDWLLVRYESHRRRGAPWRGRPDWQPPEPQGDPADCPPDADETSYLRKITECGRTPGGRWYPKTIRQTTSLVVNGKQYVSCSSRKHVQLDLTGPIPDDFFAWPEEVPPPE